MKYAKYSVLTSALLMSLQVTAAELVPKDMWASGFAKGTEIVSIQAQSQRVAVSNSEEGLVDVLGISAKGLHAQSRFADLVEEGEEITAVAFHPKHDYLAIAVRHADALQRGRVLVLDATKGAPLASLPIGVWPDSLAFSPDGQHLLVANEGEGYVPLGKGFVTARGSLSLLKTAGEPAQWQHQEISLPALHGHPDMVAPQHGRKLEREINGAEITLPFDNSPEHLEPEYVAFSPDGRFAYVSLQENNAVLQLDIAKGSIAQVWGMGMTQHAADAKEDGQYQADFALTALREPDGIALTPDGAYLLTADEGDTEPKVKKLKAGQPAGGGRTLSIFNAATGAFVADTGAQLDDMASAAGVYPDARSPAKGSEPENVVSFVADEQLWAVVALERADALALVSLENIAEPKVVQVLPLGEGAGSGEIAPEGLAHVVIEGRHYVVTGLEESGQVALLELVL
ncbi:choice-of-anchor I domain-containing protein [Atopomonas sediminilitoris]|uniref:choice-of-anchor I domain-containing protein n=1 Tax=Atopomonas sediminilitoris TaxID=2919919 RepID=UPI001F4D674A|nr:hypothetical protein [Atopomonas sediminilitoris]MCJ8168056.1 hypothetical protein [Atopomonas sediminilitoris]